MKLLIATPLYPPDIGGPAIYSVGLEKALLDMGYEPIIVSYGSVMHLPTGIRQVVFFGKIFRAMIGVDVAIALDTLSIGLPTVIAGRIVRKNTIVRVAGDQLWEHYIARTKEDVPFPEFYVRYCKLSVHEQLMHFFTGITFRFARAIVFSTMWQQRYRALGYPQIVGKSTCIENAHPDVLKKEEQKKIDKKIFLWAGRDIPIKNITRLKTAFAKAREQDQSIELKLLTGVSHKEILGAIGHSYALILPSISEDSPNFLMEGLSCGKPFISTMHNGLKEHIEKFGLFVDPFDVDAITKAIIRLADKEIYDEYLHCINAHRFDRTYHILARDYINLIESL